VKEDLKAHFQGVVSALARGDVIPLLGAGANLCDRSIGAKWEPGSRALIPHTGELVNYLAQRFSYPDPNRELARVAQYAAVKRGTGPLYADLREIFARDYPTTTLHRFLAALPHKLGSKGYPRRSDEDSRRYVVVTTNYDDLLERAFAAEGEACHVVWYLAEGKRQGHFLHRPPGGETVLIKKPNKYHGLAADQQPIVLKIHGTVDRQGKDNSFVITEDDYIDYLSYLASPDLIPIPLPGILRERHLLFLGYSLKDWNLRVILNRIWEEQELGWQFWAIQLQPDQVDQEFWHHRGVDILDLPLADYVAALAAEIDHLEPAETER